MTDTPGVSRKAPACSCPPRYASPAPRRGVHGVRCTDPRDDVTRWRQTLAVARMVPGGWCARRLSRLPCGNVSIRYQTTRFTFSPRLSSRALMPCLRRQPASVNPPAPVMKTKPEERAPGVTHPRRLRPACFCDALLDRPLHCRRVKRWRAPGAGRGIIMKHKPIKTHISE